MRLFFVKMKLISTVFLQDICLQLELCIEVANVYHLLINPVQTFLGLEILVGIPSFNKVHSNLSLNLETNTSKKGIE